MTDTTVEGFDEPKHGSDRKGFPEGLKDGTQEHRVLPSMDGTGKYFRDHTCHYGYGTKMNNSDKEFPNPFYCVEEGKFIAGKFVVLQECPECREIKRVNTEKEGIEADMKKAGSSDAEIAAAVESHEKWLRKHNRDFKFYVNVKDSSGRYFTVKYPSKQVWKVIEAKISEYKARRIPIDGVAASQGLWFRIVQSGKRFKCERVVDVVTEDVIVNGQVVEGASKPKLAPLTGEDAKKARETCLDLRDVGIRRLSLEQVARLVASRGDPTVIQAIFAASDPKAQTVTTRGDAEVEEVSRAEKPAVSRAADAMIAGAIAPVVAEVRASVTPSQATPTTPPAAVTKPVTAPSGAESQAELIARARALMEQARNMPATPAPTVAAAAATASNTTVAPTTSTVVTAAPAPAPAAATPTPKPTPKPTPEVAPPTASTDDAQSAFLAQFEFPQN